MTDFYLTLPSSETSDVNNTSARFATRLPDTLKLVKGKHLIGLTEIIFPASKYNVTSDLSCELLLQSGQSQKFLLEKGNYTRGEDIVYRLNKIGNGVKFTHNKLSDSVRVSIDRSIVQKVTLDPQLSYFIGFEKNVIYDTTHAQRPIDYSNNVNTMYIYCDAVDYSIVGNAKANLLQCIPLPAATDYGKMQSRSFNPVRYIPIANDHIDCIYIELLDEFGHPLNFNFGSTVVTLHVKTVQ